MGKGGCGKEATTSILRTSYTRSLAENVACSPRLASSPSPPGLPDGAARHKTGAIQGEKYLFFKKCDLDNFCFNFTYVFATVASSSPRQTIWQHCLHCCPHVRNGGFFSPLPPPCTHRYHTRCWEQRKG